MNRDEFIQQIITLIESNHVSSFFLNGPPRSGRTYLLNELARILPLEIQKSFVLGPYKLNQFDIDSLGNLIHKDLFEAGFLQEIQPLTDQFDLPNTWQWYLKNSGGLARQNFIVLVDLDDYPQGDLVELCTIFSSIRYLEGKWKSNNIRLHHVVASYWDHPGMEANFLEIGTSFPYTIGHNYTVWSGISQPDMDALVNKYHPNKKRVPFGQILYELTGGHPGAAIDILKQIKKNDLSITNILKASELAAVNGPTSHTLIELWDQLPEDSKIALKEMSLQRRIPATTLPPHLERLRIAGLARQKHIGEQYYLEFQSWYVELIIRSNAERLGISDDNFRMIEDDDLIPSTSTVSTEAFRLIHEIENLTRNYVTTHLSLRTKSGFHYLMGRSRKFNPKTGVDEDAYQSSEEWKKRSADLGMPSDLNPLIAYLSTRDLANLIEELVAESGLTEWKRIAQAIRALSDVRDAVMHNQLIDDDAFIQLYELREEIYNALSTNQSQSS